MHETPFDVIGIGNAIVDVLAFVDDDFLRRHDLSKSSMQLCSHEKQSLLLSDCADFQRISGGSAANTVATLSAMGLDSAFIGCVADDSWGTFYIDDLKELNVAPLIGKDDKEATGTSVILITPDSERTMNTHLGAASRGVALNFLDKIETTRLLYIEGYAYDTAEQKKSARVAIDRISSSSSIALSLSDTGCVKRHHDDFRDLVKGVHITFGNEAEFCELFSIPLQKITHDILADNAHLCSGITVVTQSARGCTVMERSHIFSVDAHEPEILLDLTGAGDQFAAGFLYGYLNNLALEDCAHLGTQLAAKVISKVGSRMDLADLSGFSSRKS